MGQFRRKMRLRKNGTTAATRPGPRGESWMKGEGLVPLPQSTGGNSILTVEASGIRRLRMGLADPRRFHGANDTPA